MTAYTWRVEMTETDADYNTESEWYEVDVADEDEAIGLAHQLASKEFADPCTVQVDGPYDLDSSNASKEDA